MTFQLFSCTRLRANISKDQCAINRQRKMFACEGCPGLRPEPVGLMVQQVSPKQEQAAEVPTVVLRFEAPEDRELYQALKNVCSDLGHDIISVLHLACRADFSNRKGIGRTTRKKACTA